MKKLAVVLITILSISLLSACGGRDDKKKGTPIAIPSPGGDIYVMEEGLAYCEKKGGQIEMAVNPEGGVAQFCISKDGVRCGLYSFYAEECGH